jgi:hypothetical protein
MTEVVDSLDEPPVMGRVHEALRQFSSVSQALLASRALLRRVDRKFALAAGDVERVLASLSAAYGVLTSGSAFAARYRTVYFDTEDLRFYHAHRRGRPERYKVRVRHHLDREMSFVEVKHRDALGRSVKWVLPRPFGVSTLDDEARAFVERHCPVPARELTATVWVTCRRITLVGYELDERVTIDCDLEYGNGICSERWPNAAIAEVKQRRRANHSPSIQALREVGVRERAISKYCVATTRLFNARGNPFKPALRALEQASR